MRNEILDIIKHTADTKIISKVIVTGTDEETRFESNMNGLIVKGVSKSPIDDFKGEFVLNNLDILKGFASIETMAAPTAKITVKTKDVDGEKVPEEIIFNDGISARLVYRCSSVASAKMNVPNERKYDWTIDTKIPASKFSELQRIASILKYPEIVMGTEDGYLTAWIGDPDSSSDKAKLSLVPTDGVMEHKHTWKIDNFFAAAKLAASNDPANAVPICIFDRGLIMIESNSDTSVFKYYIPRQS